VGSSFVCVDLFAFVTNAVISWHCQQAHTETSTQCRPHSADRLAPLRRSDGRSLLEAAPGPLCGAVPSPPSSSSSMMRPAAPAGGAGGRLCPARSCGGGEGAHTTPTQLPCLNARPPHLQGDHAQQRECGRAGRPVLGERRSTSAGRRPAIRSATHTRASPSPACLPGTHHTTPVGRRGAPQHAGRSELRPGRQDAGPVPTHAQLHLHCRGDERPRPLRAAMELQPTGGWGCGGFTAAR
jgi:hypothetical protein